MTFDEYNTDENFDKKESSLDELVKLGLEEGKSSDEIKSSLSPKWQKSKKIGEFDNYVTKYSKPKEEPKTEEVKENVTEETAPKVEPLKEATSNLDVGTKDFADKNNAISLDYASDGLYVDNNGNVGTNHKYYRESHDKLAKLQRKLSRMQGSKKHEAKSNNYIKQLRKVNKIHRHIANQRLDNLHQISTKIANLYDVVCVESLDMKSMSNKGFGNGKATLDNGYGMFLSMLEYKLSERNKYLVKVDKWFPSSQICHRCGEVHPEMKNLTIRTMKCDCSLTYISRDQNAAINILREGLRILNDSFTVA